MIMKATEDALNDQIRKELHSSYLYLAMSTYFQSLQLPGFARWMSVQSEEERKHAMKLLKHVEDRNGTVKLQAIDAPTSQWKSPLDAFERALEHERGITASIRKLYETAGKENDYAAQTELQWFITEQIEEEKNAEEIVGQLRLSEGRGAAILLLDHRLGERGKG